MRIARSFAPGGCRKAKPSRPWRGASRADFPGNGPRLARQPAFSLSPKRIPNGRANDRGGHTA